MNQAKLQIVFRRVLVERARQDQLRDNGRFKFTCADDSGLSNPEKCAVLSEEIGEVARAILNLERLSSDEKFSSLQKELTQVAAVACAWLESMELDPTEGIQL